MIKWNDDSSVKYNIYFDCFRESTGHSKILHTSKVRNSANPNEESETLEPIGNNFQLDTKYSRRSKNSIIDRPEEPSLDEEYKVTPHKPDKSQHLILKPEASRKNKPSIEIDKVKHASLCDYESEEAVPDMEIPRINKPSKLSSFDSFDRKQEENVFYIFNIYSLNKLMNR
jgi:hypothetical protein